MLDKIFLHNSQIRHSCEMCSAESGSTDVNQMKYVGGGKYMER